MEDWKKLVAGALIGVAGTVYATDEEARRNLPRTARDLPDNVRRRFRGAVSAAREASSSRRQEILCDLEAHGGGEGVSHRSRHDGVDADPAPESSAHHGRASEPPLDDATEPIDTEGLRQAITREGRPEGA